MSSERPQTLSRSFYILWTGQLISLLGSSLVQFALIWWLTQTTGSGTVLAAAAFVGLLPQVAIGPFIGPLIDRWNRKRIILAADSVNAVASLALVALFLSEMATVYHVVGLMFVRALASGFHQPAILASVALMVPKDSLTKVQGMNQALVGILTMISAPLGASLLDLLSMPKILMIDVVTALFAILPLIFIHIPQPPDDEDAAESSIWKELVAGARYLKERKGLLAIVSMTASVNLVVTPTFLLLPLLVTEYFLGQAMDLAFLNIAFGFGTVVGGILLSIWGGFKKRILTTLWGLTLIGGFIASIHLVPPDRIQLAIAAIFMVGAMVPLINGPIAAILQASVDPKFQGRVFTLLDSASTATAPIGLIFSGPLADWIGISNLFLIAGIGCSLAGLITFTMPTVTEVESHEVDASESSENRPTETAVDTTNDA